MTDLMNIHSAAQEEIKKYFSLNPVKLKTPFSRKGLFGPWV